MPYIDRDQQGRVIGIYAVQQYDGQEFDDDPVELYAPTVPQSVTRFQARAALHLAGLLPQIEALMADPATNALARLAWQDAQEFRRTSPTVLTMAVALGLSEPQLDDLFITAAGIEA